jgi:hypothetical protein
VLQRRGPPQRTAKPLAQCPITHYPLPIPHSRLPIPHLPYRRLVDTDSFGLGFFLDLIDLEGGFSTFSLGGRQRSQYNGCDGKQVRSTTRLHSLQTKR